MRTKKLIRLFDDDEDVNCTGFSDDEVEKKDEE